MKKYICIGDFVHSKNDGQFHYISANKLVELYKVNKKDCILIDFGWNVDKLKGINIQQYKILRPEYNGNYNLDDLINNIDTEEPTDMRKIKEGFNFDLK